MALAGVFHAADENTVTPMKRMYDPLARFIVFALFLLAPGAVCWAGDAPEKVLILFSDKGNPPYIMGDGAAIDQERPGTSVELLRLTAERLALPLEFKRVPWRRGISMLKSGQGDALFHASFKKERLAFAFYPMKDAVSPDETRRISSMATALYTLHSAPIQWDGARLSGMQGREQKIAVLQGAPALKTVKKWKVSIQTTKTREEALRLLLNKKVQAVAGAALLYDALIQDTPKFAQTITRLSPPVSGKPYYLLFAKIFTEKYPRLVAKFWREMADVRDSEEFRRVVLGYVE